MKAVTSPFTSIIIIFTLSLSDSDTVYRHFMPSYSHIDSFEETLHIIQRLELAATSIFRKKFLSQEVAVSKCCQQ